MKKRRRAARRCERRREQLVFVLTSDAGETQDVVETPTQANAEGPSAPAAGALHLACRQGYQAGSLRHAGRDMTHSAVARASASMAEAATTEAPGIVAQSPFAGFRM